ncbi:GNAT family N-acetyltransferase [Ottowia oryzae]|uniref:GNAT family N-acetyltransferase n=1 Tax=Ottowia oryzae TaxID=2109914 RepID=A0A2S0ME69_9BURK|nr:GNAT family N-acetyltransferase [Ottowia oryzae]AVO34192.1 GNAT family N-acetyltransferase [Ottowia oryzae]
MAAALYIRLDDLSDPCIATFLEEHLADMRRVSPPESVHALDLAALRAPDIRFWTAWAGAAEPADSAQGADGPALVGTAALKRLDAAHAELKSMRTAAVWRGQGVAAQMLVYVMDQARAAGHTRLSLETGSEEFFASARALYARHGFMPCAHFGSYQPDPHSCFMTRAL